MLSIFYNLLSLVRAPSIMIITEHEKIKNDYEDIGTHYEDVLAPDKKVDYICEKKVELKKKLKRRFVKHTPQKIYTKSYNAPKIKLLYKVKK